MAETRLNDFRVQALNGTEFGSSFLEISPDPFTGLAYFFQDDGHDLRSFLPQRNVQSGNIGSDSRFPSHPSRRGTYLPLRCGQRTTQIAHASTAPR